MSFNSSTSGVPDLKSMTPEKLYIIIFQHVLRNFQTMTAYEKATWQEILDNASIPTQDTAHTPLEEGWREKATPVVTPLTTSEGYYVKPGKNAAKEDITIKMGMMYRTAYRIPVSAVQSDLHALARGLQDGTVQVRFYKSLTAKSIFANVFQSSNVFGAPTTQYVWVPCKADGSLDFENAYAYHSETYTEPASDALYRVLARNLTTKICGWISPYGTLEAFNAKMAPEAFNKRYESDQGLPLRMQYV